MVVSHQAIANNYNTDVSIFHLIVLLAAIKQYF